MAFLSFLIGFVLLISFFSVFALIAIGAKMPMSVDSTNDDLPSPAELNTMDCQGGQ